MIYFLAWWLAGVLPLVANTIWWKREPVWLSDLPGMFFMTFFGPCLLIAIIYIRFKEDIEDRVIWTPRKK